MARRVGAAMGVGLVCGLVIGGIGGRIAMFVLRLTSSEGVNGVLSDDGFRIGRLTTSSAFLLLFGAVLGALGGLAYMLVRQWLPPGWRAGVMGVVGAVVGGAGAINPGGVDFTLLGPLWLAVALFILLPAAYGIVLSVAVENVLARESRQGLPAFWFLPLLLLLLLGPLLVVLAAAVLAWVLGDRVPAVARAWRSPFVVWLGRVALLAICVLSAAALTSDVTTILSA